MNEPVSGNLNLVDVVLRDRTRKVKPENWKDVRLAVVSYANDSANCSCGWQYRHAREKVRENAIDRHFEKRHEGKGIRL